ncbi:3-oxoacyl-[acyl-carrier protein] reductase [Paenibacillus sp. V4I3]|uniref:SDR family oxidoreductase n=1 Tax=unclassified Paenibacillus TaxID=185978 RepID=UPI002780A0E4|nr:MULTISPECIES: SDR family oxidoreductase [unclassified Paenibacillus]MDQ0875982.1 3-oxoacyl-[acyl-carrier protein] reductase [Paenibacillus sp. V4I3]MDQ0888002.1 3-oxoacyl-[acyl-carrier protein] reductase [Paenibacillus sp. V4I9]
MTNLKNKVALITGSGRGLGKAIAERYASLGANIVINYSSSKASAEETMANVLKYGVKAIMLQADISKADELREMFQLSLKEFGKIDIVVANAGIESERIPTVDISEEQFDKFFRINTKGTFITLQEAAKHVADNGRIIYISSSTTASALPGAALYASSKIAPMYQVEVLAKEIGYRGVTVNSIVPTGIEGAGAFSNPEERAEFIKQFTQSHPMRRLGNLEDVANVAEFFASELSSYVSGQQLLLSGGALQ